MNNNYLYEVSCYDCQNCAVKNYSDPYCRDSCLRCYSISPSIFTNPYLSPIFYNPSNFPYGNYYGSYIFPGIMY